MSNLDEIIRQGWPENLGTKTLGKYRWNPLRGMDTLMIKNAELR